MAMSSINDNSIGTCIDQCLGTQQCIGSDTNTCSYAQTTLVILACHGLVLCLGDILVGDQTDQLTILIDNGQLLNLVLLQNLCSS